MSTTRRWPADASFVDLTDQLFDDLERARRMTACVNVDGNPRQPAAAHREPPARRSRPTGPMSRDKLNKCLDASTQPKNSSLNQTCQAFDQQFSQYQSDLNAAVVNGAIVGGVQTGDLANRLGEMKARVKVFLHIYMDQFLPSVPPGGYPAVASGAAADAEGDCGGHRAAAIHRRGLRCGPRLPIGYPLARMANTGAFNTASRSRCERRRARCSARLWRAARRGRHRPSRPAPGRGSGNSRKCAALPVRSSRRLPGPHRRRDVAAGRGRRSPGGRRGDHAADAVARAAAAAARPVRRRISQRRNPSRISTRCARRRSRSTNCRSSQAIPPALIREQGPGRARQYAQAGVFLCAHCHVLLALWDGKVSDQLGGTSQVVRFHHHDVMPGYTPASAAGRLTLADDESDLVYHIVCSRDRPDGGPAPGLAPLDVGWFTADATEPRTRDMPLRHRMVFERANEFSADAQEHADEIRAGSYPLLTDGQAAGLPSGLRDINQVFCAADWLAIHFQKRVMNVLRVTHACALVTGLAYVSYADFVSSRILLLMALAPMVVAYCVSWIANHGSWHPSSRVPLRQRPETGCRAAAAPGPRTSAPATALPPCRRHCHRPRDAGGRHRRWPGKTVLPSPDGRNARR